MPRAFSEDLRKRIVIKRDEGYSEADISQMYGVSIRINKEPGITLEEMAVRLANELDSHIHHTTVMRALASASGATAIKELSTQRAKSN